MARLTIKKYKNNNSKNNAYGKTYGRLVYVDTLDTSDLCRHMMKHGTIYTSDIVKGVVEKFINCCSWRATRSSSMAWAPSTSASAPRA